MVKLSLCLINYALHHADVGWIVREGTLIALVCFTLLKHNSYYALYASPASALKKLSFPHRVQYVFCMSVRTLSEYFYKQY
jgi:hypothetical protein